MSPDPGVPWREVAKADLAQGEAGVMVRAARKRAKMTQEALAEALGISVAELADVERGKRPVVEALAKRLGQVLKVDYRVFLETKAPCNHDYREHHTYGLKGDRDVHLNWCPECGAIQMSDRHGGLWRTPGPLSE